jgi:ABC-type glycerol-3-phosphate transport system permease component
MENSVPSSGKTVIQYSPRPQWLKDLSHDWPIHLVFIAALLISAVPLLFMLNISLKTQGQFIVNPMGIKPPFQWGNYVIAFNVLKRPILNSLFYCLSISFGSLALGSIAGYIFARFRFPGRELLYWLVLSVLFIPGILTFVTRYVLVEQMGMLNTYWAFFLPAISGGMIMQAIYLRTFFAGISMEIMEAAWMDGAGVIGTFTKIVLPMSRPILSTLAVITILDVWNEWLWPFLVISDVTWRPMALQILYLASDIGAPHVGLQMAGYAVASLPMILIFVFLSNQFIEGLTSGALKF